MAEVEKKLDWFNRLADIAERIWQALGVLGLRPLLGAVVITAVGAVSVWAAKVTPLVQSAAPFSYVVCALIVAALLTAWLRALWGRRNVTPKVPRVRAWFALSKAPYELVDVNLAQQLWDTQRLHAEKETEHAILQRVSVNAMASRLMPGAVSQVDPEEETNARNRSFLIAHEITRLSNQATAIQQRLDFGLKEKVIAGTLVAKGFRGTLQDHDQVESAIPPGQWMVLHSQDKDPPDTVRGDGIVYSGVQIGVPESSWSAFWRALFGPRCT